MKRTSNNNTKIFSKNKSLLKNTKLHFYPRNAILLVFCLIVAFVFCYPLLKIFINTLNIDGKWSLSVYKDMLTTNGTYKALINTIELAIGTLLLTWLIGGSLAFLCEKTDFRHSKIVNKLVFISFCIPSYILSVSWYQITSKNGYLHRMFKILFGLEEYNYEPYSILACIIVLSIHLYPMIFFGVSNALKKSGGILEKSAKTSGASPLYILRTITLPLVIPTFLTTGLLIISRSMANFGVVAHLALPVGNEVLTTRIFKAMAELKIPLVCVLSVLLVFISGVLFLLSQRYMVKRNYDLHSFDDNNRVTINLGRYRTLVNSIVVSFFGICLVVPLITLCLSSFMKRWGLKISLKNMTIMNYVRVLFENELIKRSLVNSLMYGVISASIACVVAITIIYFHRYVRNKLSIVMMSIAIIPLAMPNMILAIGGVFAWINEPFKIYGTKWIIIVTYIILFIPIVIKQVRGIVENIDTSMDNAAKTLGVPIYNRIKDIFIPLIKKGMLTGWIMCFLISLREIPISLLLYSKGNETLGVMLFTIQSNSYGLEMTSTIAVIIIVISIIGNICVNKIGVRRLNQ